MAELCTFCGENHAPKRSGERSEAFPDWLAAICPKVPEHFIYEDRAYEAGPRGALHHIGGVWSTTGEPDDFTVEH